MDLPIRNINEQTVEKSLKLFRIVNYIGQIEQPITRFNEEYGLDNLNGLTLWRPISMTRYVKMFLQSINDVMLENLKQDLTSTKTFSILTDGSTDTGVIEEEIIFDTFVRYGIQQTQLLTV